MSTPAPATPTRRAGRVGWIALVAAGALLLLAYVSVTLLYNAEGRLTQSGGAQAPASTGLTASLTPIAVKPLTGTATLRLAFNWIGDDVSEQGRLGQNTRVTVITGTAVSESRYPAGTVPSSVDVEMGIDGEQSTYPFDKYVGDVVVLVDSYTVKSDGSVTSTATLPLALGAASGVSGWNTAVDFEPGPDGEQSASFTFTRAFSTQAFAILILLVAVVLGGIGLITGVLVSTRRRVVEATMLSWAAALLFALPALRNFMPNAPPIGAAIDIYVYLWVMLATGTGAVLMALAWIARDRKQKDPDRAA